MARIRTVLVLAIVIAACDGTSPLLPDRPIVTPGEVLPPLPQPAPAVPADSGHILLAGSASLAGNESTMWVYLAATAFNAGADAVRMSDLCIVQARAYAVTANGARPAWASPALPGSSCSPPTGPQTLPAGAKYWLPGGSGFSPRSLLGDSLPQGRYRFELLVRVGSDTVRVPADTLHLLSDPQPVLRDPALLKYAVETRVESIAPRYLVTRIAATNPLDRPFYLEFGACALRLHAFRTAARSGVPVWRSEARQPAGGGALYACLAYLALKLLMPGESFSPGEFSVRIPMEEILADSLPSGHYYFLAQLSFQQGGGQTLTEPSVWMAAGEADLTSSPDPLPRERVVGSVRYRAQVGEVAGIPAAVRLELTVSNQGNSRVFVTPYASDCTAQLVGYTTAAARDISYRLPSADVTFSGCPVLAPPTSLEPGETKTLGGSAILAGSPARRRYYFAAWLYIRQEPEGATGIVSVSAGDAVAGGS